MKRGPFFMLAALLVCATALPASYGQIACGLCNTSPTFRTECAQAKLVLYGTLANAKADGKGGGTVDLRIENILKDHSGLTDKKLLQIPRLVAIDPKNPPKFLIFADVVQGKIDAYRGIPVQDNAVVKYLAGLTQFQVQHAPTQLMFFFDWLEHDDPIIADDAAREFEQASYEDIRAAATTFPPAKIARWLQDAESKNPKTPAWRVNRYCSLLGHCGKPEHAELLRKLLEKAPKDDQHIDGLLIGYTLLNPQEGWKVTRTILADALGPVRGSGYGIITGGPGVVVQKENTGTFIRRYSALRTARFLGDYRPDVVDKKQVIDGLCLLLDQGDIADLAIDDLRKWKASAPLEKILALTNRPSHDIPIMRSAILRYALSNQDQPKAADHVKAMRRKDPAWVKDTEELLKLEN